MIVEIIKGNLVERNRLAVVVIAVHHAVVGDVGAGQYAGSIAVLPRVLGYEALVAGLGRVLHALGIGEGRDIIEINRGFGYKFCPFDVQGLVLRSTL